MSLRLRLTIIVVAAVSLSMCLVLWLSWERIGQEMTEQRKRDLASMLQAEESLLEEGVKNYLAYRMRLTGERRSQMQNIAATIRGLSLHSKDASPSDGMLRAHFFAEIARHKTSGTGLGTPCTERFRKRGLSCGRRRNTARP